MAVIECSNCGGTLIEARITKTGHLWWMHDLISLLDLNTGSSGCKNPVPKAQANEYGDIAP